MDVVKLLNHAKVIVEQQEEKRKADASKFNIFSITGVKYKELPICSFLRELLDPKGSHGQGDVFLASFIRQVLKQDNISESDFAKAKVFQEIHIAKDRRIDILICVGNRRFPIEVKIYAGDQSGQLRDYYNFVKNTDKNAVIYYLTLDGHEPSPKSKGHLKNGSQYRCISFSNEILSWLEDITNSERIRMIPRLFVSLSQFTDVIRELTNQNREESLMQCCELIKTPQEFHAAMELSEALINVKIEKMKDVFSEIEKHLAISRPEFKVIDRGYIEKSIDYYKKGKGNYPNLVYSLPLKENHPVDKTIVLQIEIGWYLYFGVCDWDEDTKTNLDIDEENTTYVLTNSNKNPETVMSTNFYYWWDYLPEEMKNNVDYRNTDSEFETLFDRETFEKYIDDVCRRIEMFMDEWNR